METDQCIICMKEGVEGEAFCGGNHRFCKGCLAEWKQESISKALRKGRGSKSSPKYEYSIMCPVCQEPVLSVYEEVANYTGIHEYSDADGFLVKRTFENGVLHGESSWRYPNGDKWREKFYVHGVKEGADIKWFRGGPKFQESHFVNGVVHGETKIWYGTGEMELNIHYVDGIAHGPFQKRFPNGNLQMEGRYYRGYLIGFCREWNEDGTLKERTFHTGGMMRFNILLWCGSFWG